MEAVDLVNREDLHEGQDVLITDVNVHGRRKYENLAPWPGKVRKVGRVLVTIGFSYGHSTDERNWRAEQFRIETQHVNDQYGHQQFWLPEQWQAEHDRQALLDALRAAGVAIEAKALGAAPRHTNWQLGRILEVAQLTPAQARHYEEMEADQAAVREVLSK